MTDPKERTETLAKRLRKYTKEQIIQAIAQDISFNYDIERLLNRIEHNQKIDLIEEHGKAIDEARNALSNFMKWKKEMCDKYGNRGECRISDIPVIEVAKGQRLEAIWRDAEKKERALDRQVDRILTQEE